MTNEDKDLPAGPPRPAQNARRPADDSGVDITLIRWFLTLSPLERLRTVERYAASVQAIRRDPRNG